MRKLMWFTLGFGAVCAICAYGWFCDGLWLPSACFAGVFLVSAVLQRKWKSLRILTAISLGISLGLGWFQFYSNLYLKPAAAMDEVTVQVTAYCTDYSYETEYGSAVEGYFYLDGKPYRAKFYLNSVATAEPGDLLSGVFKLRVTTEDSDNGSTYHAGRGMLFLAYQREDAHLGKLEKTPLWAYPAIFRGRVTELIECYFQGEPAAFAKALLLGDRTDIDYSLNTAFKVSGIMHIIAVSGLHVTILFTLINLLCLKRRGLVALFGIPILLLFAAVAGFSASVTRACIMQMLIIVSMLFDREYDGPTELSFAALVMLLWNPLVITSVSFQLSCGSMIGIFLFQKRIYGWMHEKSPAKGKGILPSIKRGLYTSISMTLSAISLTTPLSAYYFGAVSLVGVLTNLLTLWAVSFIFYGVMLTCLLGVVFPWTATLVAAVIRIPIAYVLAVAKFMGRIPLAAVYTNSVYVVAWLVFCYVLLAIFLCSKKKRPGALICCMAVTLCVSVAATRLELRTDDLRMTVLDVGQGQSILLQSEEATYLIDCGGTYDADAADIAAETLLSQGITHIDGLILTHFDRDHAGGALYFLSRIGSEHIYVPDYPDESGIRATLENQYGNELAVITEELQLSHGSASLTIYPSQIMETGNESSLAVLFSRENCDILVTGDRGSFGERLLLKTAQIPQLEILVAGHHGSKNSTCEELLSATMPQIVAISVGQNSYGHPAQELLDRLETYGCTVFRTDLHGNLVFRR